MSSVGMLQGVYHCSWCHTIVDRSIKDAVSTHLKTMHADLVMCTLCKKSVFDDEMDEHDKTHRVTESAIYKAVAIIWGEF